MKSTILLAAVLAALGLSACEKTVNHNPPPETPAAVPVPVPVPGPPGEKGEPGTPGQPGEPGKGTTVIVEPSPPPASAPASAPNEPTKQ